MKLNKENRRLTRQLLEMSIVDGRLDAARVSEIADRLIAEKPRQFLQILREYTHLVRLEDQKREAVVTSAIFHRQEKLSEIAGDIRNRFGRDMAIKFIVDPEVIGGMRIKVGDDVWDGTVQTRLKQLKEQL